jgi:hypothetical protein
MYWNPEFRNYREMEERLPLWKALDPANPKTEEEDSTEPSLKRHRNARRAAGRQCCGSLSCVKERRCYA